LAILVTAREHDEQYDWTMNELAARNDGLDPAVIGDVRHRKPVTGLGEKKRRSSNSVASCSASTT
jgi:hypothetical protein